MKRIKNFKGTFHRKVLRTFEHLESRNLLAFTAADNENGLRRLKDLLKPGYGWDILSAESINDLGQIVGYGQLDGQLRGFLMTPIPEPNAILLGGWAALAAVAMRLC